MTGGNILKDQAALDTTREFLEAFYAHIEETEPYALRAMANIEAARDALPLSVDEIDLGGG